MFSKQHFEALAKLIRESNAQIKFELAQDLAKLFSADNEKFNVQKFFKASGLTSDTEPKEMIQARLAYAKLGCA